MATKPRGWSGARTPSALKRVRSSARRTVINRPRHSEAKTLVAKALRIATASEEGDATRALRDAESALDRAAKTGAIHPNAAARRKSRLARKVSAALAGGQVQTHVRVSKTTGRAAAAKAAKARVAASRATKAKGAQTAAGKARAALTKAGRAESGVASPTVKASAETATGGRTSATRTRAARSGPKVAEAALAASAPEAPPTPSRGRAKSTGSSETKASAGASVRRPRRSPAKATKAAGPSAVGGSAVPRADAASKSRRRTGDTESPGTK